VEEALAHEYEIVFIIRADIDDAETTQVIEKIEAAVAEGGDRLLERDEWGKRKLAYLIKKQARGHYVLLRTASSPGSILEIERRMRLDDRIIRFMTVHVADDIDVEQRAKEAAESARIRAEEAARRRAAGELDEMDGDYDRDEEEEEEAIEA
jgi:small subunit ribosomal protein S6